MAGINLNLDAEALRPLVSQVVGEVLAKLAADEAKIGAELCYGEAEAARLLRLEEHVLRDERRRGRIRASSIVGRRIRYLRQDLVDYLLGRPWEKA